MATQIVFETHSTSEDNERGIATGWHHGRLSARGREQAAALGLRRQHDGLDAIFTSDLGRAVETTQIAFAHTNIPILHDWRLRECDYGKLNSHAVVTVHGDRRQFLDLPYPGGESWRQAIDRVGRVLPDLASCWKGARVLIIGHIATHWALDYFLNGIALEDQLAATFVWREGWEYVLADI